MSFASRRFHRLLLPAFIARFWKDLPGFSTMSADTLREKQRRWKRGVSERRLRVLWGIREGEPKWRSG
jgi:hypothetical protein